MPGIAPHWSWLKPIVVGLVIVTTLSGCGDPPAIQILKIETVHEVFPSATNIVEMPMSRDTQASGRPVHHQISEIGNTSGLLGYCVESKLVSRSGPFTIRVFLDRQLVVKRAKVISYPWQRGRDVRRRAFTRQFEGKGPEDAIELGKDIDAMTGATISCQAMAEGVREGIQILKLMKTNQVQ